MKLCLLNCFQDIVVPTVFPNQIVIKNNKAYRSENMQHQMKTYLHYKEILVPRVGRIIFPWREFQSDQFEIFFSPFMYLFTWPGKSQWKFGHLSWETTKEFIIWAVCTNSTEWTEKKTKMKPMARTKTKASTYH